MKKHKRKYPAYRVFFACDSNHERERFCTFATRTNTRFVDATKSKDLTGDFITSGAYVFIMDATHFMRLEDDLSMLRKQMKYPPLIFLVGDITPCFNEIKHPEYLYLFDYMELIEILSLCNISRSRLRL